MLVGSYSLTLRGTRPSLISPLQQPICRSSCWVFLLVPRPGESTLGLGPSLCPVAWPHSTQQPPLGHSPAHFVQLRWPPFISWNTSKSPLPHRLGTCSSVWTTCPQPSQGLAASISSLQGTPACPVTTGLSHQSLSHHSRDCLHSTWVAILFIGFLLLCCATCPLGCDIH